MCSYASTFNNKDINKKEITNYNNYDDINIEIISLLG
jgi:hypothetical protein